MKKKYDLVLDRGTLTHNLRDDIKSMLKKINKSLKKNGLFFSVLFAKDHFNSTMSKDKKSFKNTTVNNKGVISNFFSIEEIKSLCNDFKIVELKNEIHELHSSKKKRYSFWNIILSKRK